jgi:hypothetical protein
MNNFEPLQSKELLLTESSPLSSINFDTELNDKRNGNITNNTYVPPEKEGLMTMKSDDIVQRLRKMGHHVQTESGDNQKIDMGKVESEGLFTKKMSETLGISTEQLNKKLHSISKKLQTSTNEKNLFGMNQFGGTELNGSSSSLQELDTSVLSEIDESEIDELSLSATSELFDSPTCLRDVLKGKNNSKNKGKKR